MVDKKIIRAEELPEHEQVYLKKDFQGWRVVYPWKNEDGSINWNNILTGGKGWKYFFFFLLIILAMTGLFYLGIKELIGAYKTVADNPCAFCKDAQDYCRGIIKGIPGDTKVYPKLNISNLNLT